MYKILNCSKFDYPNGIPPDGYIVTQLLKKLKIVQWYNNSHFSALGFNVLDTRAMTSAGILMSVCTVSAKCVILDKDRLHPDVQFDELTEGLLTGEACPSVMSVAWYDYDKEDWVIKYRTDRCINTRRKDVLWINFNEDLPPFRHFELYGRLPNRFDGQREHLNQVGEAFMNNIAVTLDLPALAKEGETRGDGFVHSHWEMFLPLV